MFENDPILEEIRLLREARAAKFNYDVDALFDDLERRERESDREFVSYPPKRITPTIPTSTNNPIIGGSPTQANP